MKKRMIASLLFAAVSMCLFACDGGDDGGASHEGESVNGTYAEEWGGTHTITDDTWTAVWPDAAGGPDYTSVVNITVINLEAGFLVGENDGMGTYARYDWTFDGDDLYYCQIEYGARDEATALANESADRTDLQNGCNQFPWTLLTPAK